jgi:hypothetical protein
VSEAWRGISDHFSSAAVARPSTSQSHIRI